MPLNVTGYPLEFDATVNTEGLTAGIKTVKDNLKELLNSTKDSAKTFDAFSDLKKKIAELNEELAKMKAPDFLTGKSAQEIENVNRYILQQEKLLKDLQEVAAQYRQELVDTSKVVVEAPAVQTTKVTDVSSIISTQVLDELKKSFGEIDDPTQKFIQSLIELEIKLQHLNQTQSELAAAFQRGEISEKEYTETSALLVGGIKDIEGQTAKLTDAQKEYEASLQKSTGSIEEKKTALANLEKAYENLTEAQRDSPEGQDMAKNIASLSAEIKGLDPAKINATKAVVVSIRTELQQLTEQMARNPGSPLFEDWKKRAAELKENLKGVKAGIEQATNSTAGVEAFASGLRGLVGGFTAATGVIGLFSDNTEDVERVTKNAASALALLNGIQEVSNVLSKTSALNVYLLGLMHKSNTVATAAETVATEVNTAAAGVNTAAVASQAAATEGAAVAQRSLTVAMLSNPAGLIIAGIAAIAGAYLLLTRRQNEVKTSTELLAEANKKVNDNYAERMAVVLPLVEAIKQGNVTEEKSIEIHRQLSEIDKDLVRGLNEKSIAYGDLKTNVDAYSDSLRNQYRLEANKSAITESIKQEELLNKKLQERSKALKEANDFQKQVGGVLPQQLAGVNQNNAAEVDKLTEALANQKKVTNELVEAGAGLIKPGTGSEQKGRLAQIDAEIASLTKERHEISSTTEKYAEYTEKIKKLEEEKRKITGETGKSVTSHKQENKLLTEQIALLQVINDLKRGADQSGLTKEASELDKINEKYDDAIRKIDAFNKKAPQNLRIDSSQLNAPRQNELDNATARQNLVDYKKSLSDQQKIFEDFEQAKVDIGEARAKELYQSQIESADSYLDYLKKQEAELQKTISTSSNQADVKSAQLELKANNEEQQREQERLSKERLDTEINNLKTLLQEVVTYNEAKAAINKHYDDLEKTARNDKTATQEETNIRLAIIKQGREDDLTDLKNNVARQTEIYRKLGEDMTFFMADQLKERAAVLEASLSDPKLSPATKAAIKSLINQINQLLHETDPISIKTLEVADKFGAVSNGINDISNSLRGVNDALAETLGALGKISGAVATSIKSLDTLKDPSATGADKIGAGLGMVGAFFGVVGVIDGILNAGAKHRAEIKAQEDAQMLAVQKGEISINDEYRKRLLIQAQLNKLKLEGLKAEADALNANLLSAQKDYNEILNLIQTQGKAIPLGFDLDVIGKFQALGITNSYVEEYNKAASLTGKTFDELQKLDFTGQLDDKAKALFETLKTLKDEIEQTKSELGANTERTAQELTGTTTDAILDSIVQGFADGKRATADFADNFQDLMKQAILNSLKYQTLQKPLQDFYDQFAAASQSDNALTQTEIQQLQQQYDAIIANAGKQFDQLTQLTGIDLGSQSEGNSLKGAIKGITEQQAELLAGQFGGLRLTAIQQLNIAMDSLNTLNKIEFNTSRLEAVEGYLRKFDQQGIKIQ